MVDAADLKSAIRKDVGVRVPRRACQPLPSHLACYGAAKPVSGFGIPSAWLLSAALAVPAADRAFCPPPDLGEGMNRTLLWVLAGGVGIGAYALLPTGNAPASPGCRSAVGEARLFDVRVSRYREDLAAWQRAASAGDARPRVLSADQTREAQERQRAIDAGVGRPAPPPYPDLRSACTQRDFRRMAEADCESSPVRGDVCVDGELRRLEQLVR